MAGLLGACAGEPDGRRGDDTEPRESRPPVETRSRIDRAVATTGDVLTYTVVLDYDPDYQVDLPDPGADIAGFRIIDIGREDPREENGRIIEERWYKLRADLVGSYILPPVTVSYRLSSSEETGASPEADPPMTLQTSEIFVEVQSVLPADAEVTDIRELKPLQRVEPPLPWWWLVGAGTTLLAALLMGYVLWRRRRGPVEAPPRPAHEIAFEALDALRGTDFSDVVAMRRFHFAISEVIRTYVENRFGLNATDLTTEEILSALRDVRDLASQPSQLLQTFLLETDQVKFADYRPEEKRIGETYENALTFVERTRPTEPDSASPQEKVA